MSVKKLLCGAALASLMVAPAASALDLVLATPMLLAEEVDFDDASGVTGSLPLLTLTTNNDLPANNGYKLTINLTGPATFDNFSALGVETNDDDVNDTGGGGANSDAAIEGQIISQNGADGDTTVTILFDADGTAGDTTPLTIELPVAISSCSGDVSANINLTDPNDNPIEGGVASLLVAAGGDAANALECEDAFAATFEADGTTPELSLLSSFQEFKVNATTDTPLTLVSEITLDTPAANTVVLGDLTSFAAAADIATLDFEVVFEDLTGITAVTVLDDNGADVLAGVEVAAENKYTFSLTDPEAEVLPLTIEVEVTTTEQVQPQTITVSEADLTFTDAAPKLFTDEDAVVTDAGADAIVLEGASYGPFDWVGDATKGTSNIFRVTGMSDTPPEAAVNLVNSSEGVNGTYTLTLDAANVSNGEYVLRPSDIQAAAGSAFGRADVTFTFFTSDDLDVDRLMSAGGVISAFGNTTDQDD